MGHGGGLDVVEATFLLAPGMTLAIKFDLHGFDCGGIRQEVVVAVEEGRCQALHGILEEEFWLWFLPLSGCTGGELSSL